MTEPIAKTKPLPKAGFRLTRSGKLFIFGTVLAALASYLLNHNLIMLASATFMAIPLYQWLYLKLAIGKFEVDWQWPDSLFARRKNHASMRVTKGGFFGLRQVSLYIDLEGETPLYEHIVRLVPKQAMSIDFAIKPQHRGELRSSRWLLQSAAPFGLLKRTVAFDWQQRKLVFPELLAELPPSLQAKSAQRGILPKQTGDFQYLDSYREGDDVRMIHWRKSAGSDTPVMRRDQARQDSLSSRILVPDATPYFEHAVKALATYFNGLGEMPIWQVMTETGLKEIREPYSMLTFLALVQPLKQNLAGHQGADLNQAIYFSKLFSGKTDQAKSAK